MEITYVVPITQAEFMVVKSEKEIVDIYCFKRDIEKDLSESRYYIPQKLYKQAETWKVGLNSLFVHCPKEDLINVFNIIKRNCTRVST